MELQDGLEDKEPSEREQRQGRLLVHLLHEEYKMFYGDLDD